MADSGSGVYEDCETSEEGQGSFLLLLLPVSLSLVWVVFLLLYGSLVLALLLTKLVNLFLKDSSIYIGSIHVNFLTRRVVFKQLHYYCRDYSIRVTNGYAGVACCKSCCSCSSAGSLQQEAASMCLQLDGFEYHWYNKSEAYDQFGKSQDTHGAESQLDLEESFMQRWWKANQPSLHFSIRKGQLVMGNHHVERSLVVRFDQAEAHYSTTEASNPYDELLHRVHVMAISVTINLDPSAGFSWPTIEECVQEDNNVDCYLLLKTDSAQVTYSQDSPGLVPLGTTSPPKYELAVTLGDHTVINYGCCANRHRRLLYYFFFPNDHLVQAVSRVSQPGERRIHTLMDVSVSLCSSAQLNLPFSYQQTSHMLSFRIGPQSRVILHIPLVTVTSGSVSSVEGHLEGVSVLSSLPFPYLANATCISFQVSLAFPRVWNGMQTWDLKFHVNNVQLNILFAYIDFVNALLDDWIGNEPNDLLDFVPVDWTIGIDLKQYEIFLLVNHCNWLDMSPGGLENTRLAFCGSTGHISLDLPFTEFLPLMQSVHFLAKGEDMVVRHYAPPSTATRESLFALSAANRFRWRIMETPTSLSPPLPPQMDSSLLRGSSSYLPPHSPDSPPSSHSESERELDQLLTRHSDQHIITAPIIGDMIPLAMFGGRHTETPPTPVSTIPRPITPAVAAEERLVVREFFPMGYRAETLYERGWLDIACGPVITIDIEYSGRHHDPSAGRHTPFTPSTLTVDIDVPQALIRAFGCLTGDILSLKENYPGEYIKMTTFTSHVTSAPPSAEEIVRPPLSKAPPSAPYNGRHEPEERTVNIFVNFKLRNVMAEFPVDVHKDYPKNLSLPSLCTDVLRVQVEYVAMDTIVCLHVDPLSVHIPSIENMHRTPLASSTPCTLGHVVISAIDLNCHGFTEFMCQERVEYAWMMQLLIGRITGAMSPMQLVHALDWLFTACVHITGHGDGLSVAPDGEIICPRVEPISEDIKYRLFQLDLFEADVHVCEGDSITRFQSSGFDLELCTLHKSEQTLGLTWQLHSLTGTALLPNPQHPSVLLEVGLLDINSVHGCLELQEGWDCVPDRQMQFLLNADTRTQRLWFLWSGCPGDLCGCYGGCQFLGGSIAMRPLSVPSESAVYGPQFTPLPAIPRHLGLQGLSEALQNSSMDQLHCMCTLHRNLLDHYNLRYAGHRTNTQLSEHEAPSSRYSDSDIFQSARSSLTSFVDKFTSLEEVNSSGMEAEVKKKSRQKKNVSSLRAVEKENVDGTTVMQEEDANLVPSHNLHSAAFQISSYTPTKRARPEAGPSSPTLTHSQDLLLYLPCVRQLSPGNLPVLTLKSALYTHTQERRRRAQRDSRAELRDGAQLSPKFSLFVSIDGSNTLRFSLPFMDIVDGVIQSVTSFFDGRSAVSVLNSTSFVTALSVCNLLARAQQQNIQPSPPLPCPPDNRSAPMLGFHLSMSPAAFVAVQLLQHASPMKITPMAIIPGQLEEIVSHHSLLTVYLSGTSGTLLLHKFSETHQAETVPSNRLVESIKLAGKLKCPVVQVNLCALVPAGHQCDALPGLVPAQQQLDFNLLFPSLDSKPDFVLCDLLEAGIKDTSVSVAASIVTSKLNSEAILSWDQVNRGRGGICSDGSAVFSYGAAAEGKDNVLAVNVSVPLMWSQLAAPHCGMAQPSSGGLDLLILCQAMAAWEDKIHAVHQSLTTLLLTKTLREKLVLLTLISNTAKSQCVSKAFNPVLSGQASAYRKTVWFSCSQQLWNSLCWFSEHSVPSSLSQGVMDCSDALLVAAMMALISRLYFSQGKGVGAKLLVASKRLTVSSAVRDQPPTLLDAGNVNIQPSPSDHTSPSRLHNADLNGNVDLSEVFSQIDHMTLMLLRECLLPFFSAAGISLELPLQNISPFKAKFSVDFSIEMREATLFVLDYLQPSSGSSYLHTQSTAATPALLLEQLVLHGNVEHSAELVPSKISSYCLPLLPVAVPASPAKVALLSNCCAAIETVHAVINTPLLKLAKHVSMTGKFRQKLLKQDMLAADESLLTPRPPFSAPPPCSPPVVGFVAQFALSAIQEISGFEGQVLPPALLAGNKTSSSHASHIRLVNFGGSPKQLETHSQPASVAHLPHLGRLESSTRVVLGDTPGSNFHSSSSLSSVEAGPYGSMNVAINVDYGTSPEDLLSTTMDTCGEDTADSIHLLSSDNDELRGSIEPLECKSHTASFSPNLAMPTGSSQISIQDASQSPGKGLYLPQTNLLFSVFGLFKCGRVLCELQVETTRAVLELRGIGASVDTRNSNSMPAPAVDAPLSRSAPTLSLLSAMLPTYLSVAVTLKDTVLRVSDRGLPDSDLLQLVLLPTYVSIGISNCRPTPPTYRWFLKLTSLHVEMKQSAVKVHKRFQQLMPAFTRIYNEIFGQKIEVIESSLFSEASVSEPATFSMENVVRLPSKMPLGFIHFSLDKMMLFVAPLPSLTLTHTVSPLSIKAQTAEVVSFQLVVGEHHLRFNPKEQFKNEMSLRSLTLPYKYLMGTFRRSKKKKIPQLSLSLFVKQVNIDLTTDVLNQLLVVQNTFIKEVNELLQMLTSVGEALPRRDLPPGLGQNSENVEMGGLSTSNAEVVRGRNLNVVALLQSFRFSLAGVVVTVSTPLATAIRFSTGKLEMTLINTSSQSWQWSGLPSSAKQQLSLDGRVDIDINLALGYLQVMSSDVEDDLCELAYFRTRVSVRNTLQNMYGSDEQQGSGGEMGTAVDTFLISISSPHLYLQSSAVEQAILFWLNCKSVYSYWQNERKLLNVEVTRATEAFMAKINRPTQFQTPSIDFSKPRLVQITVSDVGACMPIIPVSCDNSTQHQFPALVVTIKEMQFLLNLSHKVASIGHFQTFCIRFAEKFSLRHKKWTLDPKRNKFTNFGTITHGKFRLCIASKKRFSETTPCEIVGEKLVCAFQWDMSGIIINANTDIGHHTSTLVRTMTTIASDLEGQDDMKAKSNMSSPNSRLLRKNSSLTKGQHRRTMSLQRGTQVDNTYTTALEQELAQHTRTVQKLKLTGAATDSLRSEEDLLRSTQQELAKTVQRMFRHPRAGISFHKFNQIFFSTSDRPLKLRTRMFSVSEDREGNEEERRGLAATLAITSANQKANMMRHRRHTSDVTGMRVFSASSCPTPPLDEDGEDDEGATAKSSSLIEDNETSQNVGHDRFSLPSINLEFDVTVNVDHGKIVLRTEESSELEWHRLHHSTLLPHSPLLPIHRNSAEHKHVVESVVLIPALTVRAHYQSIVGRSYSNLSASKSPRLPSSSDRRTAAEEKMTASSANPLLKATPPENLPVKRGVLCLSAVVESLPEHIKLTPSLLEFIEQVAQPTLAAAAVSISSSTESVSNAEEGGGGEGDEAVQTAMPISFPVDVTLTFCIQPSTVYLTCQPHSQVECTIQSPNVNFVISFSLFSHQMSDSPPNALDSFSPTASLTSTNTRVVPFNKLYVTGCLSTFALQLYSLKHGAISATGSREALGLTLGHALFHLSRNSVSAPMSTPLKSRKNTSCVENCHTHNKLHVSVIMNVASVVLGYDMRRLNDITAFRRFWYRTTLVEALFIGSKKEQEEEASTLELPPSAACTDLLDGSGGDSVSSTVNLDNSISAAIVVAASVDDFRVAANFAQVMGNADLLVTSLKFETHCDVSHNELVLLQLDGKLQKGEFDARAGVIAGCLLVENAVVDVLTQSQQGSTPEHQGRAALSLMEGRVDYMSSCILLARATELKVDGNDLWEGLHLNGEQKNEEEDELTSIQVKAHLSWQELQLAIHRSTTQHVFNIIEKLDDFIMQQKRRSERTLSSMLPAGFAVSRALHAYRKEQQRIATTSTIKVDSRHHWLWAVKVWSMELMQVLGIQAPVDAHHEVSLGGIIGISGESLCIVCFHGPSFRERERAVFNIDKVQASFSTQAIPGLGRWQTEATTHLRTCQQIVKLCLNGEGDDAKSNQLASIHRVSTGRSNVPNISGNTIKEWLAYACIDTFLHEDKYNTDSSTLVRLSRKLSVLQVLLVPAFTVSLINDHFWPRLDSGIPKVECTLTSSFSYGISVTTTVDHYLFLHDVVKGYVDYLEKHKLKPSTFQTATAGADSSGGWDTQLPGRQFECVCWELNPHLCLLTTVSGQFNPHISWLLERLGFKHAQTTIPKWIQRGAMDPLDKVISAAVELLIKLTASKKKALISPPHYSQLF